MLTCRAAGNILGEATTLSGNIFPEAMRGAQAISLDARRHPNSARRCQTFWRRVGIHPIRPQRLCWTGLPKDGSTSSQIQ